MAYNVGDTVLVLETQFEGKVEQVYPNFEGSGSTAYAVRMPRKAVEEGFTDVEVFYWTLLGLPDPDLIESCMGMLVSYFEQFSDYPTTGILQYLLERQAGIVESSDRVRDCGNKALARLEKGEVELRDEMLRLDEMVQLGEDRSGPSSGDFPGDIETMPNDLELDEEGLGWCVRTDQGEVIYRCAEKVLAEQWLTIFGYKDTGDGYHYQRAS